MKKKILITVLILALVAGCFAACGSSSASNDNGSKTTASQTTSSKDKAKEKKANKEKKEKAEKKAAEKKAAAKKSSSSKKSSSHSGSSASSSKTCTISITCHNAANNKSKFDSSVAKIIPSSGVIMSTVKVAVKSGDSVLDITKRIVKKKNISISVQSQTSVGTPYVQGIAGMFEKDGGSKSGWIYKVNGKKPDKGADEYSVKKGDRIEWKYTMDLGKDV